MVGSKVMKIAATRVARAQEVQIHGLQRALSAGDVAFGETANAPASRPRSKPSSDTDRRRRLHQQQRRVLVRSPTVQDRSVL
mmetsp:Transcript_63671/g.129291  ORF Transcript_63671/g.129291 Transcript_63671/m.129291 type:complete len:82 (+) Transcript_63671:249-494(+)